MSNYVRFFFLRRTVCPMVKNPKAVYDTLPFLLGRVLGFGSICGASAAIRHVCACPGGQSLPAALLPVPAAAGFPQSKDTQKLKLLFFLIIVRDYTFYAIFDYTIFLCILLFAKPA